MKTINYILGCLMIITLLNACIDDKGNYDLDTVRISNIKLEEGSKATPHVE